MAFEKGNTYGKRISSSEEAREKQRNSVKAHYEKLEGQAAARAMMHDKRAVPEQIRKLMLAAGFKDKDITPEAAMDFRQSQKAMLQGDTKAYEKLNKKAGYLTDKIETSGTVNVATTPSPMTPEEEAAFCEFMKNEF